MLALETRVLVGALVEYGRADNLGTIRQAVAVMSVRQLAKVAVAEHASIDDTYSAWETLVETLEVQL